MKQPRAKKRALINKHIKAMQLSNTQQCKKTKKKRKKENNTTRKNGCSKLHKTKPTRDFRFFHRTDPILKCLKKKNNNKVTGSQ